MARLMSEEEFNNSLFEEYKQTHENLKQIEEDMRKLPDIYNLPKPKRKRHVLKRYKRSTHYDSLAIRRVLGELRKRHII